MAPQTPRQAEPGRRRSRRATQQAAGIDAPAAAGSSGASRAPSWRARVQELEQTVGVELRSALASAMLLLADQVRALGLHSRIWMLPFLATKQHTGSAELRAFPFR